MLKRRVFINNGRRLSSAQISLRIQRNIWSIPSSRCGSIRSIGSFDSIMRSRVNIDSPYTLT